MTNSRVQLALDGRLPFEQLSPAEAETYRQTDRACRAALEPLRAAREVDVVPGVMQRVLQNAAAAGAAPAPRGLAAAAVRWLWNPRPLSVSFRPAFALAGLAAVLVLAVFGALRQFPNAAPSPSRMVVAFRLGAPGAHRVALVGDFNSWKPEQQLRETSPGVWTVSVSLEPGVYNYGFIVDGATLQLDPLAPRVPDGFGGQSSRVAVLSPEVKS